MAALGEQSAAGDRLLVWVYEQGTQTLWSYDGAAAAKIADLAHGVAFLGVLRGRMWYVNGAADLSGERELWSTDGTAAGTRFELKLPEAGGTIYAWAATPGKLFYGATYDLFVTDGTPAGTHRVAMPVEVAKSSIAGDFLSYDGRLLFTERHSRRHFASDGTAAGTVPLGESIFREPMFLRDGHAYFRSSEGELHVTDGTPAGTRPAAEWLGVSSVFDAPVFLGDAAIFAGNGGNDAFLLRRDADGTVTELGPRGRMTQFAAGESRVYFWRHDLPAETATLMTTDGTSAGTKAVKAGFVSGGEFLPTRTGALFGAADSAASGTIALRQDRLRVVGGTARRKHRREPSVRARRLSRCRDDHRRPRGRVPGEHERDDRSRSSGWRGGSVKKPRKGGRR
jgi:hypothetical protein